MVTGRKVSESMVKSCSCSVPGGSSSRLKSAHGTRRYSAWPPRYGPIAGSRSRPSAVRRIAPAGTPTSSRALQLRQVPQPEVERHGDRVTDVDPVDASAHLGHEPMFSCPSTIPESSGAGLRRGANPDPADVRGRDPDDGVERLLDARVRHLLDRDLERTLVQTASITAPWCWALSLVPAGTARRAAIHASGPRRFARVARTPRYRCLATVSSRACAYRARMDSTTSAVVGLDPRPRPARRLGVSTQGPRGLPSGAVGDVLPRRRHQRPARPSTVGAIRRTASDRAPPPMSSTRSTRDTRPRPGRRGRPPGRTAGPRRRPAPGAPGSRSPGAGRGRRPVASGRSGVRSPSR